ncbi:Creatinase/aminopeptidase [Salix suchowensis]|nr:Creatinase/aminopeptidase [Salix suchowensis]
MASGECAFAVFILVPLIHSQDRVKDCRIGIDARMLPHEKATLLNSKIGPLNSKLVFPPQNLVDLVWTDKPAKSKDPVFLQPREFTGASCAKMRPGSSRKSENGSVNNLPLPCHTPKRPYSSSNTCWNADHQPLADCVLAEPSRFDIPFNPLFQAYLYVGLTMLPSSSSLRRPRGYTDLPPDNWSGSAGLQRFVDILEEEGMGGGQGAYVRFLAWLEVKLSEGYDITEYEAAFRLTEFRRRNKYYMGLAYANISASGPNAALPHYVPHKATARMIDRDTPYLKCVFSTVSLDIYEHIILVTPEDNTETELATPHARCTSAGLHPNSVKRTPGFCKGM